MAEWDPYRIRIPKGSRRLQDDCAVLETVHHVVHVPTARRILEDGRIRAGLVYDESRLNRSRTCVNWVSANTWVQGSIYGNVEFSLAWSELVKGRHFYWIEAMSAYRPHAYRILLSDRDLDHWPHVTPYDPSVDKGPLRERDGIWYRNKDCTSEFMIDRDIDLGECNAFDFIKHNEDICRLNDRKCPDRKAQRHRIGGRVLAFLIGNDLHSIDHVLNVPSQFDASRSLSDSVDTGIDGIIRALGNKADHFGGVIKGQASRQAVLRGALALYGADQKDSALELIALLNSKEVFETALQETVNAHFGIEDWTLPG